MIHAQVSSCKAFNVCDATIDECCLAASINGVGTCYTSDGDQITVYYPSQNYTSYATWPCGYGMIEIKDPTNPVQQGQTCLLYYPFQNMWLGMWSFLHAAECMNWFDIFNVTCVN